MESFFFVMSTYMNDITSLIEWINAASNKHRVIFMEAGEGGGGKGMFGK